MICKLPRYGNRRFLKDLRLILAIPEFPVALRQTRADLTQAAATIAERDAENARLREASNEVVTMLKMAGVGSLRPIGSIHRLDAALKEAEHD